jgi:Zn-dependent metalloprotease
MKKIAFLFAITFFTTATFAKEYSASSADKIIPGSEKILVDDNTGAIKFVKLKASEKISVKNNSAWLNTLLNVSNSEKFKLYKTETDQIGYTHYSYQLYLHNYPVEDAVFYIHSKNGYVVSANGEYYPKINMKTKGASLSAANAITIAKNSIKENKGKWNDNVTSAPKLVVINIPNEGAFLAYKTDIYSRSPLARKYIYVDANSGEIKKEKNRIHHADVVGSADTKYNGTKNITTDSYAGSFRLREAGRGNGINTYDLNMSISYSSAIDFTDADNVWNTTSNQDDAAYDAHFGSEATYDYFFNNFNRNSYDNCGASINSYVHFDSGYVNAFWDGTQMTYGDGDGTEYTALTSIDVVGHEITHAVTENSANLVYSYESGALNESFSDIFGIAIDFYSNPSTANYLMGDQFAVNGIPFRSMSNPNAYGQPDTYNGTNWVTGSEDYGGVHTNSGVQNYWFYLLTNGGSGTNDIGNSFSVSSIGMQSAASISYRNLTTYLTANSQHSDARFYAIQSAIDLYGDCSAEVIAATNAWHAVGVGSVYSNSVIADFTADITYSCSSPALITFTNNSINGTSFSWDFGDGNTSTSTNPTHTYTSAGVYTVRLITNGAASCGNNDTLIQTNYITITNGGGPISASCAPISTNPGTTGMGIFNFSFESINNTSNGAIDGYQDYSCTNSTSVIEGNSYNVTITTGSNYNEDVRIWIDLNNDGQFNMSNELVYISDSQQANHTGSIFIPGASILNTPLRLRVASDYYVNTFTTPCTDVAYGQYEDYTVTIQPNTNPPSANFTADYTTVNIGQTVTFSDSSQNIPTSWNWEITGSNTPFSTLQNPTASYSALGTYPVKLIANNAFGTDSLTKTSYINVINSANMCSGLDSTNATTGILYDSGGSSGNYADNENCSFLINPGCALDVTLSFSSFYSPTSNDYMRVYDGTDATAALIGNYTYMTTPPSTITASSGSMFITWYSSASSNYSGWEANWSSTTPTSSPTANFSISDNTPPLNVDVQFTDGTSNLPNSWTWDFGDGNSSFLQSPTHSYTTPGAYAVTLISDNCFALDTISYTVNVQTAPSINVTPNPIIGTVFCGDSISIPLSIYNTGSGDLIYEMQGGEVSYLDSSSQYYSATGGNTSHDFINLPAYADSIYIEVTLNGDYTNFASEYADLLIEGTNFGKINTSNTTDGIDFIRQYAFGGTDVQNWFSDNQLNIVLDNSTGVHTGYGQQLNKVKISINGSDWLSLLQNSGNVPANDSTIINVNLNASNLFTGVYYDTLIVNSNDLTNNPLLIPIEFTVSGQPLISVSPNNINFGALQVGSSSTDTLYIDNIGCDTLDISSFTSSDISFSVASGGFKIPPFSNDTVIVTFAPDTIKTYSDTIFVNNNDSLAIVLLSGIGVGAPIISYNPTAITETITSCNDSITIPVTVYNTGQGALYTSLNINGVTSNSPSNFFDGFEDGTYNNWAANGTSSNFQITNTNPASGSTCLKILGSSTNTLQYDFTPDTIDYVSVNLRSDDNSGSSNYFMLGNASYNYGLCYIYHSGTNQYRITGNTTYTHTVANSNNWTRFEIKNINYSSKTFDLFINGTLVQSGIGFQSTSLTSTSKIKIYNNNTSNGGYYDNIQIGTVVNPDWITINTDTLNTAISDSSLFNVTLYSEGLNSGTYNSTIVLASNDPLSPLDSIPVTFIVDGSPKIALSDTCLNFGSIMENTSTNDSLTVFNNGCDTLFINNVTAGISEYSMDTTNLIILPNESAVIHVTFSPTSVGTFNSFLTISNNDVDTTICLTGTATAAPVISVNPASFNVNLSACEDSITLPLTIYNTGGSDLNYSFSNILGNGYDSTITQYYTSTGQSLNYYFDGLTPSDSVYLEITINGDYDSSTEYADLYIEGGFIQQINDGNQTNGTSIVTTLSFGGSNASSWLADGQINVMLDNSSEVNSGIGGTELNQVRLWIDGVGWIYPSINSGTISPADSSIVDITFNSTGMSGGIYNTEIIIPSNDPLNPFDTIPVTLTISNDPCANFTFSTPNSCSGQTDFTDVTINNPTSWNWDFGNGNSSTLQNPTTTYTNAGNYTVELVTCNSTSCDTISYMVTITNTNGPANPFCSPNTTNAGSLQMGIFNFSFSTINNTTSGGIDGYQDYSCTNSVTVTEGNSYAVEVTTGTGNNENVRVWIDYDNDGQFNMTNELVYSSDNSLVNHSGNIAIPSGGILSTPLRMRVASDYYNNSFTTSCQDVMYGQYEDYTVIIESNIQPPVSNFTYSILDQCQGVVHCTDLSTNFPVSWSWNFGDGTSSTVQNPYHTYTSAGIYNITMFATNVFGSSTLFNQTVTINSLNAAIEILSPEVLNQPIDFNANAIGAISWDWNFGDGFSADIPNPSYIYNSSGTYIVTLTAINGFGCSSTTYDTLHIYPLSIEEQQSQFMIFPNPNKGIIQLINKSSQNIKAIHIINSLGKYVYRFENQDNYFASQKIELKDVSTGVYFVKVRYENNEILTKKFLIQR